MSIILSNNNDPEKVEMRHAYCQTLIELAEENEKIVALDADLMAAMGMTPFAKRFPERTINCGVQEANMYGVAAGLSVTGKIPFAHTFAPFCTRRACDQIFMSCAYAKLNVKVIGSDPGITASLNGGTHMPFEDLGIMRGIPEMTVIEPTDTVMIRDIVKQVSRIYGMHYIRLVRKFSTKVYEEGSTFEIGKAVHLSDGKDVTIIASGYCVTESIKAAKILEVKGISARVLNMFTIKPVDKEAVVKSAEETGAIVTAENHNIINGLGSAVAEVLAENNPVPMERVGVKDIFGEVGPIDYLADRFELNAKHIVEKVEKVLKRKKGY
jgi:transketolase